MNLFSMNAKEELQPEKYLSAVSDKQAFRAINTHVVRLLQDKLLPLKKDKYNHLQKINLALRKDQYFLKSNSVASLHHFVVKAGSQSHSKSGVTSRTQKYRFTQDLLLSKLKKLNNSTENTPRLSRRGKMDECLQQVQKKMADFEKQSYQQIEKHEYYSKRSRNSKRKLPFIELALKAERHLRKRKHELRQKFLEEHEGRRICKQSELQKVALNLKQSPFKQTSDAQLQRELLEDIRQTMLQEKINRLKRDINHKKIVQLR